MLFAHYCFSCCQCESIIFTYINNLINLHQTLLEKEYSKFFKKLIETLITILSNKMFLRLFWYFSAKALKQIYDKVF